MLKQTGDKYTIKDKQKVNLSAYAFDVIDADYEDFEGFDDSEAKIPKGTFLNKLFNIYFPEFMKKFSDMEKKYEDVLGKGKSDRKYIDLLIKKEIESNIEILKGPDYKGVPVSQRKEYIYLTAQTVKTLNMIEEDSPITEAYGDFRLLLKAVLEEYTRLPYYKRFELYNKDKIDKIKDAIAKGYELSIVRGNRVFQIRPYRIMFDSNQRYIYLAGWAKSAKGTDYSMQSFRLSRIADVELDKTRKYSLTKDEKNEISQIISTKGVQYLTSGSDSFEIRLTKQGYETYKLKQHQRPRYSNLQETTDGYIMKFEGITERQIEFYFLQFAEKVEVIKPESTRKLFKTAYEKALKNYI